MKCCKQTENQSVYEHGLSVQFHTKQLISILKSKINNGYRLPNWFFQYSDQILEELFSDEVISDYTLYHDIGKPYCLTLDEQGRRHFPNHAEVSAETWLKIGGATDIARLIKMDMMIHTIKAIDLDDFICNAEAITLLIVGLAEVHSNAEMFGGYDSQSFKIKWSQINRRGNAICKKLFGDKNEID